MSEFSNIKIGDTSKTIAVQCKRRIAYEWVTMSEFTLHLDAKIELDRLKALAPILFEYRLARVTRAVTEFEVLPPDESTE